MRKKNPAKKPPKIIPGTELAMGGLKFLIGVVGEKKNYSLHPV